MKYFYYEDLIAIKNDEISLVMDYMPTTENTVELTHAYFHIVLNETNDVVGHIAFDYSLSSGFDYSGNVEYSIKEEYRNKKYATKALALLKKLLKSNTFDGDKDLYISTLPENIYSQKVAVNNGGILYYDGEVPKEHIIRITDKIKKVKVYQIKI